MAIRLGALALAVVVVLGPLPQSGAQPLGFELVAHQGGARALETGVSTLEFDIGITLDREPLVWHDETMGPQKCADTAPAFPGDPRYPYAGKRVHELTLAEIRTLDCGRRIATLPEIFALTDAYRADVRYDIETKVDAQDPGATAGPEEFVDVILAAVRSAGKADRVEIESFDWRTLTAVRAAEPSIPGVALWNQTTWQPGSPWLAGINPAVVGDPLVGALMVGASIVSPSYPLVDRALVDRAHALGLRVVPWTINDADVMRAQIAAGVDGIITDYPATLRAVMAQFDMPLPPAVHRQ
ncbi:glycerophosphodiester phosphodiesterase family protein [Mycobacterium sp.]|uniref:glycerophosphodiester phosphodiesterase family protein n=1 Tax=Mycobacterium sp. TaxID=1785 RepID=UPI0012773B9D|nr:glycerophosphodiester phosphodiesterase family protein [Mycobacterium sp.]KAA8970402.1 MAG: glycerophosphodiester phosphodiesterase [Mycobacterium sp.]